MLYPKFINISNMENRGYIPVSQMSEALQNKGEHKLEYLVLWQQAIIHIILF
jgi:hypothetical protein